MTAPVRPLLVRPPLARAAAPARYSSAPARRARRSPQPVAPMRSLRRSVPLAALLAAALALPAAAQTPAPAAAPAAGHAAHAAHAAVPPGTREELLGQFGASAGKFLALAEAIPADKYAWSPGEGVMTVAQVLSHVAHYNLAYPRLMGVEPPAGVQLDTLERMTDRAQIVALLRSSAAHVQRAVQGMDDAQLARPAQLYGREVAQWAVLLQLVAHMNEHLGQTIAYARMNGVVPPWSR